MKKLTLKVLPFMIFEILAAVMISSCGSVSETSGDISSQAVADKHDYQVYNDDRTDAVVYENDYAFDPEVPVDAYELMLEASRISPDEKMVQMVTEGDFAYDIYDKHAVVRQCIAQKPTKLIIPDTVQGLPVTAIDVEAISNYTVLTEIRIGKNIRVINNSAFANDEVLSKVIFDAPENLKYIGSSAFQGCKLNDFPTSFPELQYIGAGAFNGSHITEFTISSKVLEVCDMAFMTCKYLKKLNIENGVSRIDDNAFTFSSLENVIIPDSVRRLGSFAFASCKELVSVELGKNITALEDGVFRECTSLKNVKLPENLSVIMNQAFALCDSLTEIDIPASVKEIESASQFKGPFYSCDSLKEITLHEGLEKIGDFAFEDIPIGNIKIPDSVKEIGKGAFTSCGELEQLTIPGSMLELPQVVVYNCVHLKKIIIGEGMISVGYLFDTCLGLETIELPDSISSIDYYYMKSSRDLQSIYTKYKGKSYPYEQKDELLNLINT